jgi:DNA-binding transcriptional LysR family regulator
MQMLTDGRVNFALTSLTGEYWPDLEFHKFLCDPVCLIVPLDHPWTEVTEIESEDLLTAEFILREDTSGTYLAVSEALGDVGISINDLEPLLILGNSEAIALAVQEGLGVGFISEMVVDRVGKGQIAKVKIKGMDISRDIYIGRHVRRPATLAQTSFWDFIHSKDNPIQCDQTVTIKKE